MSCTHWGRGGGGGGQMAASQNLAGSLLFFAMTKIYDSGRIVVKPIL